MATLEASSGGKGSFAVSVPKVFVVLPAFNEQQKITEVVRQVRAAVPNVVVVDDGSTDLTARQARSAGAVVLRHCVNRGQGAALQTGISYSLQAGARYVVTFDSDGQHRVEDIPRLLEPLVAGRAEVALGSRFIGRAEGIPLSRRLLLKGAVLFTRAASGARVSDAHNGLRAFSRRAAERLDLRMDRMAHASEIVDQIHAMKLVYVEIPVTIRYTQYSLAKGQRTTAAFRVLFDYLIGRILG